MRGERWDVRFVGYSGLTLDGSAKSPVGPGADIGGGQLDSQLFFFGAPYGQAVGALVNSRPQGKRN